MGAFLLKELPEHNADFERVRTALFCGQPDRIPLMELGVNWRIMKQLLGRDSLDVKDVVEFQQKAGYDFVMADIFNREEIGISDDELRNSFLRRAAGGKETIETWQDFEKFSWPEQGEFNLSFLAEQEKLLPEKMKVILISGLIFDAAYLLMGFEKTCIASVENPGLIKAIVDRIGETIVYRLEGVVARKSIGAYWLADDIAFGAGLMLSPAFFRKFVFPWYRKIAQICAQREIPLIFHSDGNYGEIIPDLIDIGFNAIHPLEPGSMDIMKVKEVYGKKLCLIGNIDIGYTLTRGTPEEVAVETKKRIKEIGAGGGYCVSSSSCITEYVKPENYFALLDTTLKYGKYPI